MPVMLTTFLGSVEGFLARFSLRGITWSDTFGRHWRSQIQRKVELAEIHLARILDLGIHMARITRRLWNHRRVALQIDQDMRLDLNLKIK